LPNEVLPKRISRPTPATSGGRASGISSIVVNMLLPQKL
jgi:hypothetical protein